MSLQDHNWQSYYPGDTDAVEEVFVPALRKCSRYHRISGDFSSSVLSVLAPGLEGFVERGGKIRLMVGLELFEEDLEAIQNGQQEDVIREKLDWKKLREGQPDVVRETLAWLIANDILDMKVGAVTDEFGNMRTSEYGQWHQKIAVFEDESEDMIGMAGSPNASFKALRRNRESLSLHSSWQDGPGESRAAYDIKDEFDQLWANNASDAEVMEIPEALRADMIEPVPHGEPDWDNVTSYSHNYGNDIEPYPYQKEALSELSSNNNRLLIKHATGTGKTWTSLFGVQRIASPSDVVVVMTPTKDLVRQWVSEENIGKFFAESTIIPCSSDFNWKKRLYNQLHEDRESPLFVVSTMHPETAEVVFDYIEKSTEPDERLLVADEVHNLGAPMIRGTVSDFDAGKARIGLSATPFRNDGGDQFITDYFGENVHEITIEEAIEEYEVLSPYKYKLHVVSLSKDERREYAERSSEISHLYHKYRGDENESILSVANRYYDLQNEIFDRADILKECSEKTDLTREIFDTVGTKTIIFCNTTNHTRGIQQKLSQDSTRMVQPFLGEYSDKKRQRYLEYFEEGTIDTLVSIDCLTEGIDVPACDSAILVANSSSTRESVQRRGRVLRESEGEGVAEIHDFITLPVKEARLNSADLESHEVRLVNRELDRVERMNEAAKNSASNNIKIIDLRSTVRKHESNDKN
ncbi:DEAD/DEAH box helicase family protein [Halorubrum distributum]|uniref:DEAD/DEAH box helicase n=1 Tax=Halorubrum distributum TaxID=29283 RepID=A0A6B1IUU8_9EURY|nr:DEAD/DEAH box helicase family protein [Halorubrum terrestre]MYL66506.1 DEAD/DEAH box helicase [Halorubrum terrestre]